MLSDAVSKYPLDSEPVFHIYQKAIDILIDMQRLATPAGPVPTLAHSRGFDQALFVWEFDHFIEYGIEKNVEGLMIPKQDKDFIRAIFSDIAFRLATVPQVFTHRDYHSRNLMVQQNNEIQVIDFQDALMGPKEYDLASLLRDSYIDLPEQGIDCLITYYIEQWNEKTGGKIDKESLESFLI